MNCIAFMNYDDARAALDWLDAALGFEQLVGARDARRRSRPRRARSATAWSCSELPAGNDFGMEHPASSGV